MKKTMNYITLEFLSRSSNEAFARTAVACFAAQMDPTLGELEDIKTAVSEAVTNAIVHGYPNTLGKVTVKAKICEGNVLEVSVKVRGRGIRMWRRPGSPCSPPVGRSVAAWASPLWRASWTIFR